MGGVLHELVALSDYVFGRTRARLEGLTDEEYHWEPVSGCWGVRQQADGSWRGDPAVLIADPAPLTTIAWRLWHLIDMYGEQRAPMNFGVEPHGVPVGLDDPDGAPPGTADEALAMLDRAHDRWRVHLTALTDDSLGEKVGAVDEHRAEDTRLAFALHMLDEHIHHGAEVAALRDQWRWKRTLDPEPILERIMRGDVGVVDDIDAAAIERLGDSMVSRAGIYGRWELVRALLAKGAPAGESGTTALHIAAGAGEADLVEELLGAGANPRALDLGFNATPGMFAEFFGESEIAARLATAAEQATD